MSRGKSVDCELMLIMCIHHTTVMFKFTVIFERCAKCLESSNQILKMTDYDTLLLMNQ